MMGTTDLPPLKINRRLWCPSCWVDAQRPEIATEFLQSPELRTSVTFLRVRHDALFQQPRS